MFLSPSAHLDPPPALTKLLSWVATGKSQFHKSTSSWNTLDASHHASSMHASRNYGERPKPYAQSCQLKSGLTGDHALSEELVSVRNRPESRLYRPECLLCERVFRREWVKHFIVFQTFSNNENTAAVLALSQKEEKIRLNQKIVAECWRPNIFKELIPFYEP